MKLNDGDLEIVIVDGDDDVIQLIQREIRDLGRARLATVCRDALCLKDVLNGRAPDLIFLDPAVGPGPPAEVLDQIADGGWPMLVLVTGLSDLAVAAYDRRVVDFVVKPTSSSRVAEALARAGREAVLRRGGAALSMPSVVWKEESGDTGPRGPGEGGGASFPGRLMIKEEGRIFFVEMNDIRYVRSDGNYLRIYVGDSHHLARGTMQDVKSRLDPRRFIRIHRSTIVNVDWVKEFRSDRKGRYSVLLEDGSELVLSRSYRDEVLRWAL